MFRRRDAPADVLIANYQALLERYGPDHRAVQWSSKDAQHRRFAVLTEVVEPGSSVMDVGCGLGDLLEYLRLQRGFTGAYLGLDFVPEFIEHARRRFADDDGARFELFDARHDSFANPYDYVLISGTFNNLVTDSSAHLEWIHRTVERAFAAANTAVAFNNLSIHVNQYEPDLFYSDPADMLTWCAERCTRRITLRHDYNAPPELGVPVDYTLYLFKNLSDR